MWVYFVRLIQISVFHNGLAEDLKVHIFLHYIADSAAICDGSEWALPLNSAKILNSGSHGTIHKPDKKVEPSFEVNWTLFKFGSS